MAIVPNTLAFNHTLAALHKAACQDCSQQLQAILAENAIGLFNQMLNRGRAPPDCSTYDILTALLARAGAVAQALHVYQVKLQQVGLRSIAQQIAQQLYDRFYDRWL